MLIHFLSPFKKKCIKCYNSNFVCVTCTINWFVLRSMPHENKNIRLRIDDDFLYNISM